MDYQIVLSPLALADLEEIVRYVRVVGCDPRAAHRLGTRILDLIETLARLPERGTPVRARPGVRKLLLSPYLIFYRAEEESRRVSVLRIWHGAQDRGKLRLE